VPGRDVPHPFQDPAAYCLGQARVEGLAHAAGFQRAEVFDVDHGRAGRQGLVDGPPGGRHGEGIVEVHPPVCDVAGLVPQGLQPGGERMMLLPGGEPLVVTGFRVEALCLAAEPVGLREDPARAVPGPVPEGGDRPVRVQPDGSG
jgi:hypothetical protein